MPIQRILGYLGFVISLPIAFYYVVNQKAVGIGMIGLDVLIISFLIIISITTIFYVGGRILENKRKE
ncbi:MAG: hypothetical protein M3Q80_02500 [bacterium]|nr:hypothetical protein [bacterium]